MRNKKMLIVAASLAVVFGSIYGTAHYAPALFGPRDLPATAAEQPAPVPHLAPAGAPGHNTKTVQEIAAQLKVSVKDFVECQRRIKAPGEYNSLHDYTCAYIHMSIISLPLAQPEKLEKFVNDWNPGKWASSDELTMSGVPQDERMIRTYALIRRMRDALGNPEPFDYVHEPKVSAMMRSQVSHPVLEGGIGAQLSMENMWQIQESVFGNLPKDAVPTEESQKELAKKLNEAETIGPGHRLLIDAPVMNGPSWGVLKSGDIVDAIDVVDPTDGSTSRKELTGVTMSDAVKLIRGTAGTTVVLHILRKNPQGVEVSLDLSLLRARVKESAVTVKDVGSIRHIIVSNFGNEALMSDFHQALVEAKDQGVKGIVIDLRGNPGGRLDYVTGMLEMVVPRGEILMSRIRTTGSDEVVQKEFVLDGTSLIVETKLVGESDDDKDYQPLKRVAFDDDYDQQARVDPSYVEAHPLEAVVDESMPMAVLINGNSYSASEIFAGAIGSTHRGMLAGQPSAGKNDIMAEVGLPECATNTTDKVCQPGAIDVIEGTFFPGGMDTDLTGVLPDLIVKQNEDFGKTDAQLDAVVAALNNQIAQLELKKAAGDSSRTVNSDRFKKRIKDRNDNDAKPAHEQDPQFQQ